MKGKRIILLTIALLLSFVALGFNAHKSFAIEPINLDADCSLVINFTHEDKPVEQAIFSLYRVADLDENGRMTLAGEFKQYEGFIDLYGDDNMQYAEMGETLKGLAERDNLTPDDMALTDAAGDAVFPNSDFESILKPGVYLVLGEPYETTDINYQFQPMVISLPHYNEEIGGWDYSLTAKPKYDTTDFESMKLVKIWSGRDENETIEAIEIEVFMDGKSYTKVRLDESNDWQTELKGLERGHRWSVVEHRVPNNWNSKVSREQNVFVIENTYKPKGASSTPTPTPPTTLPPPPFQTPTPPPDIPFTAVVWWPVPALAAVGIAFLILGYTKRKREKE